MSSDFSVFTFCEYVAVASEEAVAYPVKHWKKIFIHVLLEKMVIRKMHDNILYFIMDNQGSTIENYNLINSPSF
jgi:hypothetical protein